MGRSTFSFALIVLLVVNLALSSSAIPLNAAKGLVVDNRAILLSQVESLPNDETAKWNDKISDSLFIGDLVVGKRRDGETVLQNKFELINSTPYVSSKTLYYYSTGIFHYLSIRNDEGSYLMACETPNTLGSKLAEVNVRLDANSRAVFTVSAASH